MNATFEVVIDSMIAEQGDQWLDVEGLENRSDTFNAVVVTDDPSYCYRLVHRDGRWIKLLDRLNNSEMQEFFAAFGSHWNVTLNSWIKTSSGIVHVRAAIKNGRKAHGGFSISIDAGSAVEIKAA